MVIPPSFHIMVKPRGPVCNLECKYCYYLSKQDLYPDSNFLLSEKVLKEFTRQYIEAQQVSEVTFSWQGGEPTLIGLNFFKKAIEYQKRYSKPGMRIINTFQTNGTLLNDEWGQFLRNSSFLVGISIDGPPELHDVYRVDKKGKPSFIRVKKGLNILKKHKVEYNVLTCVSSANADYPLKVYRFLRDELETQFIQFIPIVERRDNTGSQVSDSITSNSVTGKQYGEFLQTVFDEWVYNDVGKVFVQIFEIALEAWIKKPVGLCIFAPTCGTALVMEHNGDLYSCDHFVEPNYKLGNILKSSISELVSSQKQFDFGRNKKDSLPQACQGCDVRFVCNGGCPKNRVSYTEEGEPGLNYLCDGYKTFFSYIDPYMQNMAKLLIKNQPASNIMKYLRKKDIK